MVSFQNKLVSFAEIDIKSVGPPYKISDIS